MKALTRVSEQDLDSDDVSRQANRVDLRAVQRDTGALAQSLRPVDRHRYGPESHLRQTVRELAYGPSARPPCRPRVTIPQLGMWPAAINAKSSSTAEWRVTAARTPTANRRPRRRFPVSSSLRQRCETRAPPFDGVEHVVLHDLRRRVVDQHVRRLEAPRRGALTITCTGRVQTRLLQRVGDPCGRPALRDTAPTSSKSGAAERRGELLQPSR